MIAKSSRSSKIDSFRRRSRSWNGFLQENNRICLQLYFLFAVFFFLFIFFLNHVFLRNCQVLSLNSISNISNFILELLPAIFSSFFKSPLILQVSQQVPPCGLGEMQAGEAGSGPEKVRDFRGVQEGRYFRCDFGRPEECKRTYPHDGHRWETYSFFCWNDEGKYCWMKVLVSSWQLIYKTLATESVCFSKGSHFEDFSRKTNFTKLHCFTKI